jgi:glutamate--cysteine ligase
MGRKLQDVAKDVLAIAHHGLKARGAGEEAFLDVLDHEAETGKTAADELLERYNREWNGDISKVFTASAY